MHIHIALHTYIHISSVLNETYSLWKSPLGRPFEMAKNRQFWWSIKRDFEEKMFKFFWSLVSWTELQMLKLDQGSFRSKDSGTRKIWTFFPQNRFWSTIKIVYFWPFQRVSPAAAPFGRRFRMSLAEYLTPISIIQRLVALLQSAPWIHRYMNDLTQTKHW